jgi:hypothetical protein
MIGALDDEIVRYLSLYFDSEVSIIKGRTVLLGLEVGQSMIRMNEARGHCHKIGNIYETHLKRWFHSILDAQDTSRLEWLFDNVKTADSVMLTAMEAITLWLKDEAQNVLNMVDAEDRLGANTRIRAARLEVRDARVELTNAMCNLRALQAQFIAASKLV